MDFTINRSEEVIFRAHQMAQRKAKSTTNALSGLKGAAMSLFKGVKHTMSLSSAYIGSKAEERKAIKINRATIKAAKKMRTQAVPEAISFSIRKELERALKAGDVSNEGFERLSEKANKKALTRAKRYKTANKITLLDQAIVDLHTQDLTKDLQAKQQELRNLYLHSYDLPQTIKKLSRARSMKSEYQALLSRVDLHIQGEVKNLLDQGRKKTRPISKARTMLDVSMDRVQDLTRNVQAVEALIEGVKQKEAAFNKDVSTFFVNFAINKFVKKNDISDAYARYQNIRAEVLVKNSEQELDVASEPIKEKNASDAKNSMSKFQKLKAALGKSKAQAGLLQKSIKGIYNASVQVRQAKPKHLMNVDEMTQHFSNEEIAALKKIERYETRANKSILTDVFRYAKAKGIDKYSAAKHMKSVMRNQFFEASAASDVLEMKERRVSKRDLRPDTILRILPEENETLSPAA